MSPAYLLLFWIIPFIATPDTPACLSIVVCLADYTMSATLSSARTIFATSRLTSAQSLMCYAYTLFPYTHSHINTIPLYLTSLPSSTTFHLATVPTSHSPSSTALHLLSTMVRKSTLTKRTSRICTKDPAAFAPVVETEPANLVKQILNLKPGKMNYPFFDNTPYLLRTVQREWNWFHI